MDDWAVAGGGGAGPDGLGCRYEGEWVRDHREGRGRMTREDGAAYDGEWKVGGPDRGRCLPAQRRCDQTLLVGLGAARVSSVGLRADKVWRRGQEGRQHGQGRLQVPSSDSRRWLSLKSCLVRTVGAIRGRINYGHRGSRGWAIDSEWMDGQVCHLQALAAHLILKQPRMFKCKTNIAVFILQVFFNK